MLDQAAGQWGGGGVLAAGGVPKLYVPVLPAGGEEGLSRVPGEGVGAVGVPGEQVLARTVFGRKEADRARRRNGRELSPRR